MVMLTEKLIFSHLSELSCLENLVGGKEGKDSGRDLYYKVNVNLVSIASHWCPL